MPSLFALPQQTPHERVLVAADAATGMRTLIALHSTARGPGFGGCRFWAYENDLAAHHDALRLSQGMSYKNALAGLPFGGGKAVIVKPKGDFNREQLFAAFARAVDSLQGAYITAEDVGTTTADMRLVQQHTPYVSGIPRDGAFGGDPSPKTAWGVFVSIQAGARAVLGRSDLQGLSVALQGLGAVGWHLAEFLHEAGARLVVADIDAAKCERARSEFGATVLGIDQILAADVDVLAPCALGASLSAAS
ncbi:MAG: Glu/Leu/Phe/Val dehydrogenase dimerization domain-containing protein, partial [Inhella sp.]